MGAPKDPAKRKEWIENLSKASKGKSKSQKHKDNISIALTGYKQTQKHKDNLSNSNFGKLAGPKHPRWKGEEYQDKNGRWWKWIDGSKYYRYRYIAEQCLGRKLTDFEVVHHINEECSDDRPENLYVFPTQSKHMKHHALKIKLKLISNLIK